MKRIFFDIILFLFIFLLPWWLTVFLAILGLFIFKNFYEFIATIIIIYVLSSIPDNSLFSYSTLIYLIIIVFYFIAQFLKNHIILYNNK